MPLARLEPIGIVVADEPMRRVEDRLPAAVVVDQHDAGRLRVRVAEAEDVPEGGAAEAVDALVVVADHRDVAVRLRPAACTSSHWAWFVSWNSSTRMYRYRAALLREDGGVLPQQAEREAHLVAEVEPIGRAHAAARRRRTRRQLGLRGRLARRAPRRPGAAAAASVESRRGGEVGAGATSSSRSAADERDQRRQEAGRIAERAVSVQRQLEQVLAQEDDLLGARQDGRPVGEPGLEGVLAQEPVAEGVEGADDARRCGRTGTRRSTRSTISSAARSVKVSARISDGLRALLGDEPGDAAGDDRRLAGPGAGHDEERAVAVRHRLALAGGQVRKQRRLDAEVRTAGVGGAAASSSKNGSWSGDGTTGGISSMVAEEAIHPAVIGRLSDSSPVAPARQPT